LALVRENEMFPISPIATTLGYVVIAVLGGIIGILAGILFSLILKTGVQRVVNDAFIGAIGSVVTVIGCSIVPWPRNTTSEPLAPGLKVETTMNRFQHPYIAAIIIAIMLPALHQWIRARRVRSKQ
jgi:H+/Cl- antiporter ClcA